MFQLGCLQCKTVRDLKGKPRPRDIVKVCKSCSLINKKAATLARGARTWERTCDTCHKTQNLGRKPTSKTCGLCSSKQTMYNISQSNCKPIKNKTKYVYFCPHCPSVRELKAKRLTANCAMCARVHGKKIPHKIRFDFEEMKMKAPKRYFSYCDGCDAIREVSQSQFSQYGYSTNCRKHAKKAKSYKKKTTRVIKAKDKTVSRHAIEKEIEKNRLHRESQKKIKPIPMAKLTEEEMMAIWLSKHNVTVIQDTVRLSDLGCGMKTGFCRAD